MIRAYRIYYGLRHLWKMRSLEYAVDFITHRRLKDRKGECLKCGKCCGTKRKCEWLRKDNTCSLYYVKSMSALAPWCFKECPYSPLALVEGCGYYWGARRAPAPPAGVAGAAKVIPQDDRKVVAHDNRKDSPPKKEVKAK